MSHYRAVDIQDGVAMIVTDLHGEGAVYDRLRNKFLALHKAGEVDRLIICGDLIHGYGNEAHDASLRMLLDVRRLQTELGNEVVILLLGNHEMPHIYGISLSKGTVEFTPRFEQAMMQYKGQPNSAENRADIITFLKSLPFYVRTKAGVLITHAGAAPAVKSKTDAEQLLNFNHDTVLQAGDEMITDYSIDSLRRNMTYQAQVKHYLAVEDIQDARYTDLLRGMLISQNSGLFSFLWDVLFATNEQGWTIESYGVVLYSFLRYISKLSPYEQRVVIAGHIVAKDGYTEVGTQQLRLASYAHAHPREAGRYLLLDCAQPVSTTADLLPGLQRTMAD